MCIRDRSKVIWGVLLAGLALSLMLSSEDGIEMLKTLSIVVGFPFAIIKLLSLGALHKALKQEEIPSGQESTSAAKEEKAQ